MIPPSTPPRLTTLLLLTASAVLALNLFVPALPAIAASTSPARTAFSNSPNGIALSPDGEWLYVALSYERRVVKYKVGPGGSFEPNPKTLDGSYTVTGDLPGISVLDSMAVDCEGNLYVTTMIPEGYDPNVSGGITVISPDGKDVEYIEITLPDGEVGEGGRNHTRIVKL
mgnify:CR=1 FL=1